MGNKRFKPTRYYMYNKIQKFFDKYHPIINNCLLVGDSIKGVGNNDIIKNTAITDMLPTNCNVLVPAYPDMDIHHTPYDDNTFDCVIADQVLEHVEKPWIASLEIKRILKPKGWAIITTCLMNYIHGVPEDYFRFTSDGLRVLFEDFSYIEEARGYENPDFINKIMRHEFKIPVKRGSLLEKEVTSNKDNINLYLVWIICQK